MNKATCNLITDCRCGVSVARSCVAIFVYYMYAVRYFVYCIFWFFAFPDYSPWTLSNIAI